MSSVRVLLVDDNAQLVRRITEWLKIHPQINVVQSDSLGQEAIEQVTALKPDLVLMDISMPGMNGFEMTRQIKNLPDAPRVILMSLQDAKQLRPALTAGADDFVSKANLHTELLPIIKALFPERFED